MKRLCRLATPTAEGGGGVREASGVVQRTEERGGGEAQGQSVDDADAGGDGEVVEVGRHHLLTQHHLHTDHLPPRYQLLHQRAHCLARAYPLHLAPVTLHPVCLVQPEADRVQHAAHRPALLAPLRLPFSLTLPSPPLPSPSPPRPAPPQGTMWWWCLRAV